MDPSPTYDLLIGLDAVAAPAQFPRWRAWAELAGAEYTPPERRRLRRWFGADGSLGRAFVALIPRLSPPAGADELVAAIAALPAGDLLRIVVTSGYASPDAPLDATDLLALTHDSATARAYADRYLRLFGQGRTRALRTIADPEGARADLLAALRRHAGSAAYRRLLEETADERTRALASLRGHVASGRERLPPWLTAGPHLEGFAQVVFSVSAVLDTRKSVYYQEIARPLLDGTDYEPLIVNVGTRLALGEAPASRRQAAPAERGDGIEHAADFFAVLADPSRLRLMRLLAERPRYGTELAAALGMSGATVSHHADQLMRAGLVAVERRAHRTYYALQVAALRRELEHGDRFILDMLPTDESGE